jgi:hypothetical protein
LSPWLRRLVPYDSPGDWLRGLGITLAAAVFMSLAGAFGSGKASLPVRLGYWLGLMLLGWLWGAVVARFFFPRPGGREGLWWRIVACSVVLSIPFSAVVAYGSHLAFRQPVIPTSIPGLLISVTAVALVMTTLNVLADNRAATTTAAAPAPPRFLDRLPLKLRGAEIWAVEAEDHYLRLHTSRGQDLILMRLADAVAELEGIEGAQTHRSWWVARDGMVDARRGDGRATLTLRDGTEAPVSRTYARALRERRWI